MLIKSLALVGLASRCASLALAITEQQTTKSCTEEQKIAAVQQEIKTISSHSSSDAAAIPLASLASRTFVVAPTELLGAVAPVNVGLTADSVRSELVALATMLSAEVPPDSVHYTPNANGSLTSDFIQLDHVGALPNVTVREIHDFNDDCQITTILGYVHGKLTSVL